MRDKFMIKIKERLYRPDDEDGLLFELKRNRMLAEQKERMTWWPQAQWEGLKQGFRTREY